MTSGWKAFFATIKMPANLGVLTFISKEEVLQIMCDAYWVIAEESTSDIIIGFTR